MSARNNLKMLNKTKNCSSFIFEMEDMGVANYILGVRIIRNRLRKLLGLSQNNFKGFLPVLMNNAKHLDTTIKKNCLKHN